MHDFGIEREKIRQKINKSNFKIKDSRIKLDTNILLTKISNAWLRDKRETKWDTKKVVEEEDRKRDWKKW